MSSGLLAMAIGLNWKENGMPYIATEDETDAIEQDAREKIADVEKNAQEKIDDLTEELSDLNEVEQESVRILDGLPQFSWEQERPDGRRPEGVRGNWPVALYDVKGPNGLGTAIALVRDVTTAEKITEALNNAGN